jgi:hypothetical protein
MILGIKVFYQGEKHFHPQLQTKKTYLDGNMGEEEKCKKIMNQPIAFFPITFS